MLEALLVWMLGKSSLQKLIRICENNYVITKHFHSITMKWVDKRFIERKKSGTTYLNIRYNEHRQTECPSNEIPHEEARVLWKPNLRVLNSLKVVT